MNKSHHYTTTIQWTGNQGVGTINYKQYERSHDINIENKPTILGSSDPAFRGDKSKHNPEELFVSSLSACHMLWYLHLCAEAGVVVLHYTDSARGVMTEKPDGSGQFTEVVLNPFVVVQDTSMMEKAKTLHQKANELCFIANSVNFTVKHHVTIATA